MDWHQDSVQHAVLGLIELSTCGKVQTLTDMSGHETIAVPTTKQMVPQMSSGVLALDSWKYCSGQQYLTAQHLLNVFLRWPH